MVRKAGRHKKDINVSYKEYCDRLELRGDSPLIFDKWVRIDKKSGKKLAGDSGETPIEKATRLGTHRLNKALNMLDSIKILGKSSQYAFTEDQKTLIVETLLDKVSEIKNVFSGIKKEKVRIQL